MNTSVTPTYKHFVASFGIPQQPLLATHAPGRSEIAGNHTDHQGGRVIGGALDVAIDGMCCANGTMLARIASEGYEPFEVDLSDLTIHEDEKNTTASLVRGMAAQLKEQGLTPAGFDMALTCTVPVGGGLSSSAAIEAALGRAMEALWASDTHETIAPLEMARLCQRTENEYFGKPCGLLDQATVCLGGLAYIDFKDPKEPRAATLEYDFEEAGYALCLVTVGADHANLTEEYAAIPGEMKQVAAFFDAKRLVEVPFEMFLDKLPQLRGHVSDRALLRSIHYYTEDLSVRDRWDALQAGAIDRFLELTRASGTSSAMYLQNVSHDTHEQHAMLALALAQTALEGKGVVRIHGGGFGGTIQCFVALDHVDLFTERMDTWLGAGSCKKYRIDEKGAYAQWV